MRLGSNGRLGRLLVCGTLVLTGCGGTKGEGSSAVVRIGAQRITSHQVSHWSEIVTRGAAVPGLSALPHTPREQATVFLITNSWLTGEAAAQGHPVSSAEVARALRRQKEGSLGGVDSFREALAQTGETEADLELAVKGVLASDAIRRTLLAEVPAVTDAQVLSYYKRHIRQYRIPEKRYFRLLEYIPTRARAVALKRLIEEGKFDFVGRAFHENAVPELLRNSTGEKKALEREVFSGKIGVLVGPVKLLHHYALYELTKIVPASTRPPASVSAGIARRLGEVAREQKLRSFTAAWRARWSAQTSCDPGVLVQQCATFKGRRTVEQSPFADELAS